MIFVILALQGKTGKINILSKGLYTTLYAEYLKVLLFCSERIYVLQRKMTMDINKIGWSRTVNIYPPL